MRTKLVNQTLTLSARAFWAALTLWMLQLAGCSPHPVAVSHAFINGTNIAWVNFAEDIGTGNPPLSEFRQQFKRLAEAAGPGDTAVARLWLHVDGRRTPEFGPNGEVTGPGPFAVQDLKAILDVAAQEKVKLMLVPWAHDLLRTQGQSWSVLERNRRLFTDDRILQSYIDKGLTPLLLAARSHPGLFGWDIFNEPEGITVDKGWDIIHPDHRLPFASIQKFVNRLAGAARRVSGASITVGSVDPSFLKRWEDEELVKAGGDPDGYLDYFQVHYYASMGPALNPFQVTAGFYGVSKPIMVGEFWPHEAESLGAPSRNQAYAKLMSNGYIGALAWKDAQYPDLEPILEMIRYNRAKPLKTQALD